MKKLKTLRPGTILILSFLFIILIGTILLMLPFAQKKPISLIDAAFSATSATCVTGLLTICSYEDLTVFGQFVIFLMIQIGGLGLMSFVALALITLKEKLDFNQRNILKEALNRDNFSGINDYLLAIIRYTFIIEASGFLLLLIRIYDGSLYSIFQALFLSVSAFCNAGMDIFGNSSLLNYQNDILINLVIDCLIIFGGLGFVVFLDLRNTFVRFYKQKRSFKNYYKSLKVHTRIVLLMTGVLLISGTFIILLFEFNNSLAHLGFSSKLLTAFFNSVTLRTAGFYTLDYSIIRLPLKMLMCVYMLIGGSPGGTAGGLKTTTFFLLFCAVKSQIDGTSNMHLFKRHIPRSNFIKASTIVSAYFVFLLIGMVALTCVEKFDFIDLLFEACSAIGTVGLTIGITPSLSLAGKMIIMILMFIGRTGPISITMLMKAADSGNDNNEIRYPKEEIMVG